MKVKMLLALYLSLYLPVEGLSPSSSAAPAAMAAANSEKMAVFLIMKNFSN